MTITLSEGAYSVTPSNVAVLSVLDLALIADTLNASTAVVDNGWLFQYSASARRETMQRIIDIMAGVQIQVIAK